jgi:DNA repair exonuclease SbcCD nuclease subunit
MRWLLIGDPHAVVDELDDMQALIEGIVQTVKAEKPDYVLFMGDQHHNHAIMHVEVMAFWRKAFVRLGQMDTHVLALVGNHDMPGDSSAKSHAMMAYEGIPGLHVVDQMMAINECLLIPYRHSGQDFINDLASAPNGKVVFCHQTFDGSKYENGMYAPDGISLAGFEDRQFISGHIHTAQRFSNVMYIGAPRWRSLSDVGVERALFLVDIVDGKLGSGKTFDTAQWCQKLLRVEDRQEAPLELEINPRWKYIVDVIGDENFIKARKARWAGCRVRTFKTQNQTKQVSESMGIHKAIQVFMDTYVPKYGTNVDALRTMVNQRLGNS